MTSQTCLECGLALGPEMAFCPACGAKVSRHAQEEAERVSQSGVGPIGYAAMEEAFPAPPGGGGESRQAVRAALPKPGEVLGGNLRLVQYLGAGSLCATYTCESVDHPGALGILKLLQPRKAADPVLSDDFLFLAKSVSRYRHPGIARILEARRHDGDVFYTMEWVQGTPLRLWLLDRLTIESRVLPGLDLFLRLLDAFREIHEHGCYGCLKPENIFVTERGPVVTDFGVPGFLTAQEFEFNAYARRYLPYMAPELRQQWSNLVPQSDMFSLGAVLYEILLGRPPAWPLKLPSDVSPHFGIDADEIIQRAMAAQPFDRFSTIDAFQEAVGGLIENVRRQLGEPAAKPAAAPRAPLGRRQSPRRPDPTPSPQAWDASQGSASQPPPARPSAPEGLPPIRDTWSDATSDALENALGGEGGRTNRGVASPWGPPDQPPMAPMGGGDRSVPDLQAGDPQSPLLRSEFETSTPGEMREMPLGSGYASSPYTEEGRGDSLGGYVGEPTDEDVEEGPPTPAWAYALLAVLAATLCALAAVAGLRLTP